MKNVINETHLNDFTDEIMLLTKSEIFDRFDYYNFLMLFSNENNSNKTDEGEQAQMINVNENENTNNNNKENNMNNIDVIKEQKGESNDNNIDKSKKDENTDNNTKEEKNEKNNNINSNNNTDEQHENVAKNNDVNEDNNNNKINENKKEEKDEKSKNDDLEKKLKLIVHKIKTEGGAPANYFSQLKEIKNINEREYEVINVQKLKEFLENKNIELTEEDINHLKEQYGFKSENNEDVNLDEYINNENFVQKLLSIIQNESDNDDNFMENIPKMDFTEEYILLEYS
jgi:hypothetical protein